MPAAFYASFIIIYDMGGRVGMHLIYGFRKHIDPTSSHPSLPHPTLLTPPISPLPIPPHPTYPTPSHARMHMLTHSRMCARRMHARISGMRVRARTHARTGRATRRRAFAPRDLQLKFQNRNQVNRRTNTNGISRKPMDRIF